MRNLLIQRRKCHKLFENLKCLDFDGILAQISLDFYKECEQ